MRSLHTRCGVANARTERLLTQHIPGLSALQASARSRCCWAFATSPTAPPAVLVVKSTARQAGSLPATVGVVSGGSVAGIQKTRLRPGMVHREDGPRRSSSMDTADGNRPVVALVGS